MRRTAQRRSIGALIVAATLVLASCSSTVDGSGTATTPSAAQTVAPSTSSSSPPSSTSSGAPVPSASLPADSSSPAAEPCAAGVDYCDRFGDATSGWPVVNRPNYFANYSPLLGGSYRMGERTANGKTQLAPFDVTTVSSRFGTRIEADATLGRGAPATSYLGLVCWDHTTDAGSEAGFLFFVTDASVDATLLDDTDGQPHTIAQQAGTGFVRPYPAVNHLAATCQQRSTGSTSEAVLTLAVNGTTVLRTTYADSVKNFAWSAGPGTGLLVGGVKSDVYYDNVAITGL